MSRFRPGLVPTLVVLALLPLLVWLGFWQLQRADEKRALLAAQAARLQAAPVAVGELERSRDPAFLRVRLEGFFDDRHSLILDNRSRDGQVGVELLQPFYDQPSGLWLLVNRGWLPWPDRRQPPRFDTPEQPLTLTAWVYVPASKPFQLRADAASDSWPRLITAVEPAALWQRLGRGGLPYEIRLEPGPAAYRAEWPVVAMGPEKHLGYAVQWFALAAALLGLFVYLGLHNAREKKDESSHRPA